MLLCTRCAGRFAARLRPAAPSRALSRDTSEEVPTTFSSDLEENKTSITILNEDKSMVFFERFGRYGFKLSTGIFVLGPVLAFPKSVFSWRVSGPADIGPGSLAALRVLYPRPDIFLLGKGDPSVKLDVEALSGWFRQLRLNFEILPTEEALSTFNFLNSEGRYVAGAFLPPSMRDMYTEEMQALEVAKRRRHFQLADSTGGTYGAGADISVGAGGALDVTSTRRRRLEGETEEEAESARVVSAAAEADGQRKRLAQARKRVDSGEDDGDSTKPKK